MKHILPALVAPLASAAIIPLAATPATPVGLVAAVTPVVNAAASVATPVVNGLAAPSLYGALALPASALGSAAANSLNSPTIAAGSLGPGSPGAAGFPAAGKLAGNLASNPVLEDLSTLLPPATPTDIANLPGELVMTTAPPNAVQPGAPVDLSSLTSNLADAISSFTAKATPPANPLDGIENVLSLGSNLASAVKKTIPSPSTAAQKLGLGFLFPSGLGLF